VFWICLEFRNSSFEFILNFHFSRSTPIKITLEIDVPVPVLRVLVWILLIWRRLRYGHAFRRIKLNHGRYAIVEPVDYEELNKHKWHDVKGGDTFYAVRSTYKTNGRKTTMQMHREIMRPEGELWVDHKNHNGLDNRRANLRNVTPAQNNYNSRLGMNRGRSKYKGVKWCEYHKKWRVVICHNGKNIHIGYFDSEIEAAKAYDEAAKKYRGEFAALNSDKFKMKN